MGQPKAQGQRSIQIDRLRVPCVSHQTAGDEHGLVFGSRRQLVRAAPISKTVYLGHTEPRSAWNCSNEPTPDRPRIQVGSPYRGHTAGASQATKKRREESPEARQRGYTDILQTGRHWLSVGSRWLPNEMVPAGFLGASGGVGTTIGRRPRF